MRAENARLRTALLEVTKLVPKFPGPGKPDPTSKTQRILRLITSTFVAGIA